MDDESGESMEPMEPAGESVVVSCTLRAWPTHC